VTTDEAIAAVKAAGGIVSVDSVRLADLVPVATAHYGGHDVAVWVPPEQVTADVEWAAGILVSRWIERARRNRYRQLKA
jgi:hypothetical protein